MPSQAQAKVRNVTTRTSKQTGPRLVAATTARENVAQVEPTDRETQAAAGQAYDSAGRLTATSINSWTALAQVAQDVNRELVSLWTASGQEAWRLFGELQAASLGVAARVGESLAAPAPVDTQQLLWAANADAYARYNEELQLRVEQATGKIQESVNELADRVQNDSREARRANGRRSARR